MVASCALFKTLLDLLVPYGFVLGPFWSDFGAMLNGFWRVFGLVFNVLGWCFGLHGSRFELTKSVFTTYILMFLCCSLHGISRPGGLRGAVKLIF